MAYFNGKDHIKVSILFLVVIFLGSCMYRAPLPISEEEVAKPIELVECEIEHIDYTHAWTVIDFDEGKTNDYCLDGTYPGFQEGFRDLDIYNDLCIKQEALEDSNGEKCLESETCFMKNYCITEYNEQEYSCCSEAEDIEKDYCELLRLRDEVGYRPTSSTDCSNIFDVELKNYCEEAYDRKE